MAEPYSWQDPSDHDEAHLGIYDEEYPKKLSRFMFMNGKEVSRDQLGGMPIIYFKKAKKAVIHQYDCLITTTGSPVVNQRVADLLKRYAPDDIQLFDVRVQCTDGELGGYQLVNIIHTIIGLDHERSVYKRSKTTPELFTITKRMYYKPGCLGTHQIARDQEDIVQILVSQELYDVFQAHKVTGVELMEPNEFLKKIFPYVPGDETDGYR